MTTVIEEKNLAKAALKAFRQLHPDYKQEGDMIDWDAAYAHLVSDGLVLPVGIPSAEAKEETVCQGLLECWGTPVVIVSGASTNQPDKREK